MKKLVSLVLVLVLMSVMVLPTHAKERTSVFFDAESLTLVLPSLDSSLMSVVNETTSDNTFHPDPVQGEYSYSMFCDSTYGYLTYFPLEGTDVVEVFDMTQWEYIELDVYASQAICFDWRFAVTELSPKTDKGMPEFFVKDALLPEKEWVHIRMPIAEFVGGEGVDLTKITKYFFNFNNIADAELLEPSHNVWLYIDNVVATRDGAGSPNELTSLDEENELVNSSEYSQTPTNNETDQNVHMIFDGETRDGCTALCYGDWNIGAGPVRKEEYPVDQHPTAYEGQNSLGVVCKNGIVYYNYYAYFSANKSKLLPNLNDWNQLEFYIYSHETITFDLDFRVSGESSSKSFTKEKVSIDGNKWSRIVMPIGEFSGRDWKDTDRLETFTVEMSNIVRTNDSENTDPIWLYFDNFLVSGYDPVLSYGDIDGENDVTASDALMVLQSSVDKLNLSQEQLWRADVDGVEGITSSDALAVLMCSVGKIDKLPVVTLID